MHRGMVVAFALVAASVVSAHTASAQVPIQNWTERPDARAPAGLTDDAILAPGSFEAVYRARVMSYEGVQVGTQEISADFVLRDWDLAPLSMTRQRHEIEIRAGLLDWLGAAVVVPIEHTSAEFVNEQLRGNPSSVGLGDVELHALFGVHDTWPYRAHLIAGVSFPTGSVTEADQLPNGAIGGPDRTLPYPMQPGDGTFALLPGAVFVAENAEGTVGLRADARIPVGENDRGWTRGSEISAQTWLAYRFTDWVSGSLRLHFRSVGDLTGADRNLDAFSSPLAHPDLQSGSRIELPVGANFHFGDGALQGSRLQVEVLVPLHQDLDGPQLKPSTGLAVSWGMGL